jgi:hypothetical protein
MQEKTLEEWSDRIQSYEEHLELLCKHSRKEYCVGCGMTYEFLQKIKEKAREEGRKEYKEELLGKLPEEKEDMFTESNINKCFSELINIEKKPLNELLPDLFPDK